MNIAQTINFADHSISFMTRHLFVDSIKFKEFKRSMSAVSFDNIDMQTTLCNYAGLLADYKRHCESYTKDNSYDDAYLIEDIEYKVSLIYDVIAGYELKWV